MQLLKYLKYSKLKIQDRYYDYKWTASNGYVGNMPKVLNFSPLALQIPNTEMLADSMMVSMLF